MIRSPSRAGQTMTCWETWVCLHKALLHSPFSLPYCMFWPSLLCSPFFPFFWTLMFAHEIAIKKSYVSVAFKAVDLDPFLYQFLSASSSQPPSLHGLLHFYLYATAGGQRYKHFMWCVSAGLRVFLTGIPLLLSSGLKPSHLSALQQFTPLLIDSSTIIITRPRQGCFQLLVLVRQQTPWRELVDKVSWSAVCMAELLIGFCGEKSYQLNGYILLWQVHWSTKMEHNNSSCSKWDV